MIIDVVDPEPGDVVVDPACGSGTFLLLAIKAIRNNHAAQDMDQGLLLRTICHNIVGIVPSYTPS